MAADSLTKLTRLWTELRKGIDKLAATSSESKINAYLEKIAVLGGAERQALYSGLEDLDDDEDEAATDKAIANAKRRWKKVEKAMFAMRLPLSAKAWKNFRDAMVEHLENSPKDIGGRLASLSRSDRAQLAASVKFWLG